MTKEQMSVDSTGSNPAEVVRLPREVVAVGRRVVLTEEAKPPADMTPVKSAHRLARRWHHGLTADDPIWGMVGAMTTSSDGATDVSANKYKYLADAYAPARPQEKEGAAL
jgi:hypothetical protein